MDDRHVLVVVRGYRYREDLRALRPYIREYRPVLLAVDGGADALLEAGYRPHVIIGDMDSVSDEALRSGAELVVHAYPDGRAPGMARLQALGLDAVPLPAAGHQRGRGAARRRRVRRQPDRGRRHALDPGGVPRQGPARHGVRRSSPTCGSAASWSTPGACTSSTRAGSPAGRCSRWCSPPRSRIVVVVAYSPAGPILGNYFSATWHTFAYWFTGLFK